MIVGVDLDGVVCDFVSHYRRVLRQLEPEVLQPLGPPTEWNFERGFGYSEETVTQAWQVLRGPLSGVFWKLLRPLPGATQALITLQDYHDIVYITKRPRETEMATIWWVQHVLRVPAPVVLADDKADVCEALNVGAMIDDAPENLRWLPEGTIPVLVARPWNEGETVLRGIRVPSLEKAVQLLTAQEEECTA